MPERYLLIAMRDSVRRVSLTTPDHTDVTVTTLNDLDSVISLDLDPSQRNLYVTDVHHDVIRSRDAPTYVLIRCIRVDDCFFLKAVGLAGGRTSSL